MEGHMTSFIPDQLWARYENGGERHSIGPGVWDMVQARWSDRLVVFIAPKAKDPQKHARGETFYTGRATQIFVVSVRAQ
jgi:hypothetical protein